MNAYYAIAYFVRLKYRLRADENGISWGSVKQPTIVQWDNIESLNVYDQRKNPTRGYWLPFKVSPKLVSTKLRWRYGFFLRDKPSYMYGEFVLDGAEYKINHDDMYELFQEMSGKYGFKIEHA